MVKIWRIIGGPLLTNCYIVSSSKGKALIIDPGVEFTKIENIIYKNDLEVRYVIATHAHIDHVYSVPECKDELGAKFLIHKDDVLLLRANVNVVRFFYGTSNWTVPKPDYYLSEGFTITVDDIRITVLHTPGHTPGSVCLLMNDDILFTGDTLFRESIGRTDLPGSSWELMIQSLRRLIKLPDHLKVYPGHGETSYLGYEKKNNPFLFGLV